MLSEIHLAVERCTKEKRPLYLLFSIRVHWGLMLSDYTKIFPCTAVLLVDDFMPGFTTTYGYAEY